MSRIAETNAVNLIDTVDQLRRDRFGIMITSDGYIFMTELIVAHIVESNLVPPEDMSDDVVMFKLQDNSAHKSAQSNTKEPK